MTTRIPYIRWCGAVRCGGASSLHKKVDRLVAGQSRVLTPSISVAVTKPLHFQSDVQQRRFFTSPAVNNYTKLLSDDLVVRSFSSTAGDVATSKRDDTNQVCIRYALMAASIHFSLFVSPLIAKPLFVLTANHFNRRIWRYHISTRTLNSNAYRCNLPKRQRSICRY